MTILTDISIQTNTVDLTESGARAVLGLLEKRDLSAADYALRVFISGGGCSGFQYGMALEGEARDTDFTFAHHGVKVVVDEVSMDYLRGATIDYVEDIMGSGFKIENPNAVAACGSPTPAKSKTTGSTSSKTKTLN